MKSLLNYSLLIHLIAYRPLLRAGASYLCLFILIAACSSFTIPIRRQKKNIIDSGSYAEMTPKDYADHLASLKKPFLNTPGIKVVKLSAPTEKYLQTVLQDVIYNNEIFFKELKSAQITIIDSDAPLHFSLPKGEIFFSKGLLAKYIKHESMLVSVLAYELVRSEKLLYPKDVVIPIGFVPMERMLSLSRLSLDEKMEVHKWAHHITVRSGYDGEYYLSWLQTQNRNTADFILQVGDANQITREESLFKAFLIKNSDQENSPTKKNSSRNFYSFINTLRDGTL